MSWHWHPIMTLNGFCYIHLMVFIILSPFNPYVHKMGPWKTKHQFWRQVLIGKCREVQIPSVPLFSSQKTYIIIVQSTQEILNFVPIYFESSETHNLNKDHNFFWINPSSSKIMIYVFYKHMEFELSTFFLCKTGCQKYGVWVPMGHMMLFMLKCFQVEEIRLVI